jgi:glycopeptide antibiotics resistance protein
VAGGLAVAYAAFLIFTVFWPSATYASGSVSRASRLLYFLGTPTWITPPMVEFAANIVLFVPFSLLGAVLLHRWSWRFWLAVGFCTSCFIELSQLVLLSGRSADVRDVISNTLGALLGALLARRVRSMLR